MKKNKSSISQAKSYTEIGAFWDTHDLGDYWDQTEPVAFDVDIQSEIQLFALDKALSNEVANVAKKRGISAETLLNLWIREKLREQDEPQAV